MNGQLLWLTWNKAAGKEVTAAVRLFHSPDADTVVIDYAFRLDPRDETIAIADVLDAVRILDSGNGDFPGYVSPQAAWELFRAIIAAAIVTPNCRVERVALYSDSIIQDRIAIHTADGTHGTLMFWPILDTDIAHVTWEVGSELAQQVSGLTTSRAIETVLRVDPLDRPAILGNDRWAMDL